jgi:hypothetical protein
MELLSSVVIGLAGGIVATTAMTLMELPFWKLWRLHGVLEWHENQVLISKFLSLDEKKLHFSGIFGLHYLNGALGGVGLALALYFMSGLNNIPLIAISIGYGFLLWILTLVPIHKPITGVHPWNHPLGRAPAIASLAGHLLYGVILGIFLLFIGN